MRVYPGKPSSEKNGGGSGMQTRHHFSVIDMGPPVSVAPAKDGPSISENRRGSSPSRKRRKKRDAGDDSDDVLSKKLAKLKSTSRLKTTQELVENLVPSFSSVEPLVSPPAASDVAEGTWSEWQHHQSPPKAKRKRRRLPSSENESAENFEASSSSSRPKRKKGRRKRSPSPQVEEEVEPEQTNGSREDYLNEPLWNGGTNGCNYSPVRNEPPAEPVTNGAPEEEEEEEEYQYWQTEEEFRLTGGLGPEGFSPLPSPPICDSADDGGFRSQRSEARDKTPEIIFVNDDRPTWKDPTLSDEIMSSSSEESDEEEAATKPLAPPTPPLSTPPPVALPRPPRRAAQPPPVPSRPVTEEMVVELHNEALPNVNGNFDVTGEFRRWHESAVVESYEGDLLPLLPFVVIE